MAHEIRDQQIIDKKLIECIAFSLRLLSSKEHRFVCAKFKNSEIMSDIKIDCAAIAGHYSRRLVNRGQTASEEHLAIVLDRAGAATVVQVVLIISITIVAIFAIGEVLGRRRPTAAQRRARFHRLLSCVGIISATITLTVIVICGNARLETISTSTV